MDTDLATLKQSLLVTGAAGLIAGSVVPLLAKNFRLVLLDKSDIPTHLPGRKIICDIADKDALQQCFEGIDFVLHLAAESSMHASFEALLAPNIVGTRNVFAQAALARCKRVIFASSINVVLGYGPGRSVAPSEPVAPVNAYGATKCFGEALAHSHAQAGLSCICVRIGAFWRHGIDPRREAADPYAEGWISDRDLAQLFRLCIDASNIEFAIVHAQSRHHRPRLCMRDTIDLLGFSPQDGSV